eukprot:SAG31_NODE_4500_length_3183_cov_29.068093_4_plen_50_part_01
MRAAGGRAVLYAYPPYRQRVRSTRGAYAYFRQLSVEKAANCGASQPAASA